MWIDPALTRIANWIIRDIIPPIKAFFREFFSNTIFETMTTEELQIYFLKIALQSLVLLCLYRIGVRSARRSREKKKYRQKKTKPIKYNSNYEIAQKKWSSTGWYWDEKKQSWIPPDYLSEESKKRWKWDDKKKIWVDLEKQDKDSTEKTHT